MPFKKKEVKEVVESVEDILVKEDIKIEDTTEENDSAYYVYDSKYNIYSFTRSLSEAEKLASTIDGSFKELK